MNEISKLSYADMQYIGTKKYTVSAIELAKEMGISWSRVYQIWRGEYYNANAIMQS